MNGENDLRVDAERLRDFAFSVFRKLKVREDDARIWADVLIETSLRGVDSHGIMVLPLYAAMVEAGGISLNSKVEVVNDNGNTLTLDGGGGTGPVIASIAMEMAISRASELGLSFVAVRNSNHFGAAAYYAMKAMARDMCGLSFTNAGPALAVWGGKTKVIGSNAFAVAIPAGEELPIVFDAAIGSAAGAKIFLAAEKGEKIPDDWMLDKNGNPTTDPNALLQGGVVLPFGKHKGSGLGLILDVMTGVISGGLFGTSVKRFSREMTKPDGVCHSFAAIDVNRFLPVNDFKSRVDQVIREVKKSEKREGFDQILLPGERGFITLRERRQLGIPLYAKLVGDLRSLGAKLDVEPPF